MNFLKNKFSRIVLGAFAISVILQGCGSDSATGECCQGEPNLADKIKEVEQTALVPEVLGDQIVYVDRNITVIQYVDRNVTVIHYVDRNVTVDVIKVRPEAEISGFKDGAPLTGDILVLDAVNSSDVDGNVTKYLWTLDDVNISTEKNPTLTLPTQEGSYKLCLEVTDNDSLVSKMVCKTFVIPHENENPTAAITGLNDQVVKTKCPVLVSGTDSLATDGDIESYVWTIDKNTTLNGKDQSLSFDTLGEHEVCLEVTDVNGLKDTRCSFVDVKEHEAPTAVLIVTDLAGDIKSASLQQKLKQGSRYNMSCAGSKDDCGNEEPMTCEWNAHSYSIDAAGNRVDFISDCLEHIGSPTVGEESWILLCGAPYNNYKYVEIELKITDQFGKTKTRTDIFEVTP